MILRSSSTPILSSLLPSRSDSPIHSTNSFTSPKHSTLSSPKKCPPKRLSFQQKGSTNAITSPSFKTDIPSSASDRKPGSRIRRARSEGNLNGLTSTACNSFDENTSPNLTRKYPRKPHCPVLQPIPAFSEDGRSEEDEDIDEIHSEERLKVESRKVGDDWLSLDRPYMKSNALGNMVEMKDESAPSKIRLARGLGATIPSGTDGGRGGGRDGGHNGSKWKGSGRDGSGGTGVAEYYKRMVEENPGNPLFLSNYAQFLHQSNDLKGAEEYYARAILIDPSDSRILSRYAQVIWELHQDEGRASSYFQRALQVAPSDSQVLAAYASFLWETQQAENPSLHAAMNPLISGKQGLQILI